MEIGYNQRSQQIEIGYDQPFQQKALTYNQRPSTWWDVELKVINKTFLLIS